MTPDDARDALPRSLDEAFARMVHARNVTDLAASTGFSRKDLYRWATPEDNPSGEHRDPPAKVIVPLAKATGRLDVLHYIANRLGCVVVPIQPHGDTGAVDVLESIGTMTRSFGAVQMAIAEIARSGRVAAPAFVLEEIARFQRAAAELARQVEKSQVRTEAYTG
jgi:DNA-binding phage protein